MGARHVDDVKLRLAAAYHGVPVSIMRAVAAVESGYSGRNDVRGKAGEIGRMQIKPATAKAHGCWDLRDHGANIACGAKILRRCYERTHSWSLATGCYNWPANPVGAVEYRGKVERELGRQWLARLDGVMR